VRQIFDWAGHGVSTNEITKRLSESGVVPPSQRNHDKGLSTSEKLLGPGYWKYNKVVNILSDKVYIGATVQGKTQIVRGKQIKIDPSEWVCVTNTHQPIVSRKLFDRVQALRQQLHEQAKTYNDFGPYSPNIFKGKIFCSRCGHPMRRKRQNKDGVYFFHCDSRWKFGKAACVQVSIKEAAISAEILSALIERPGIIHRNVIKAETAAEQGAQTVIDARLRDVNKGLDRDGRLLRSLYESLISGLLTQAEYTLMKSDYSAKIEALSRLADEIRSRGYESKARAEQHSDFAGGIFDAISAHELTVEIMDILVERICVNPDKSFHVAFSIKDELGEVLLCG